MPSAVLSRARSGVAAAWREATAGSRLLLAGKTALAAAIAWWLAPLIPFAEDRYSYYAPLGVLVSMYPTIAGSLRTGLQALVGLGVGLLLGVAGTAIAFAGAPPLAVLAVVVGVGTLVGGVRSLGEGAGWVAIAGMFVLLVGRQDAEGYSLSYLVSMAFGVVVGVAVNYLIVPPLYLTDARKRVTVLRDAAATGLRDVVAAVEDDARDRDALEPAMQRLFATVEAVGADVAHAERAHRGNPRGRRHVPELGDTTTRLHVLEDVVFYVRDLSDVVLRMPGDDPTLEPRVRATFVEAGRCVAEVVEMPLRADGADACRERAEQALATYERELDARVDGPPSQLAGDFAAVLCLRRILEVCTSGGPAQRKD